MRIGYKLFRVKKGNPGKLFPLFVLADEPMEMGVWLEAKSGEKIVDGRNMKVKSKLGPLKYRPGFHITEIPYASHIGIKENNVIKYMKNETVWCEVAFSDTIDYTEVVRQYAYNEKTGKVNYRDACLDCVPKNGFYYYKTSPVMFGSWIIADQMKILRVLEDGEVAETCKRNGCETLLRKTPMDLAAYGFTCGAGFSAASS